MIFGGQGVPLPAGSSGNIRRACRMASERGFYFPCWCSTLAPPFTTISSAATACFGASRSEALGSSQPRTKERAIQDYDDSPRPVPRAARDCDPRALNSVEPAD